MTRLQHETSADSPDASKRHWRGTKADCLLVHHQVRRIGALQVGNQFCKCDRMSFCDPLPLACLSGKCTSDDDDSDAKENMCRQIDFLLDF